MGLNDGLEILHHFSGGVTDSSGNGRDATLRGSPTLTTDKNGVSNQAYDLNGTTDYIELDITGLDFTTNCTISSYFYYDNNWGATALTAPFSGWASNTNAFHFQSYNDGRIFMYIYKNSVAPSDYTLTVAESNLKNGEWNHVVLTTTGSSCKFYVNGKLISTGLNLNIGLPQPTRFYLGAFAYASPANSNFFNGKVDEFRFYSRELSDYEVVQLYTGYDTDADSVQTLHTNLLAYYSGDDTPNDSHTNVYNGIWNGTPDYNTGKNNNGFEFNATANNYVSIPDLFLNGLTEFTFNTWIKTDINSSYRTVIANWNSSDNQNFVLIINGLQPLGYIYDTTANSNYMASTTNLTIGIFAMVTITFKVGEYAKMYINNVNTATAVTIPTTGLRTTTQPLWIGGQDVFARWWDGVIDETSFWSRRLTIEEIDELYNSGAGKFYPLVVETGYSNKINGVTPSKVNGVAVANISKVNNT